MARSAAVAERRLLVTGATGFVGHWVIEHWRARHPEVEIWATSDQPRTDGLQAHRFVQIDLRQREAIAELVRECQPTQMIHLAGLIGSASLSDHLSVNVLGTENLLDSVRTLDAADSVRILQPGSAAMYGLVREDELPISEDQPCRPLSAYAISKLTQELLAEQYWRSHGLPILRTRVFNLLGPRQPDSLVPMTFLRQLADIEAGRSDRMRVGRIDTFRDFVDVRDLVQAFDLLLERGRPERAYNIGSGTEISIRQLIEQLFRTSGLSPTLEEAKARVRPNDVQRVRADISRISGDTGWSAAIPIEQSITDMWRSCRA